MESLPDRLGTLSRRRLPELRRTFQFGRVSRLDSWSDIARGWTAVTLAGLFLCTETYWITRHDLNNNEHSTLGRAGDVAFRSFGELSIRTGAALRPCCIGPAGTARFLALFDAHPHKHDDELLAD